jgi:hypothetical protein
MQKFNQYIKFDRLLEWLNDSYDYDQVDLKANTKKDEQRHKNEQLMEMLQEMLANNQQTNESNITQNP